MSWTGHVQIESLNRVSMDDFKRWAQEHLDTGAAGARKLSIQVSYVASWAVTIDLLKVRANIFLKTKNVFLWKKNIFLNF